MKTLLILFSFFCLLLNIVPAFMVFYGIISLELNKTLMLVGTLGWFITAPFWMNRDKKNSMENS